jgi:ketosteroid isomerase-like protein
MYSRREDVTVANPFGMIMRGWPDVGETIARAAALYRDGEVVGFEQVTKFVTPDLACTVETERFKAKVAGRDEASALALRVTSIFRREDGGWKVVHRHADPLTTARPPESIIQE